MEEHVNLSMEMVVINVCVLVALADHNVKLVCIRLISIHLETNRFL
jgi:hypothetical protein